jgi:hypothetical protein
MLGLPSELAEVVNNEAFLDVGSVLRLARVSRAMQNLGRARIERHVLARFVSEYLEWVIRFVPLELARCYPIADDNETLDYTYFVIPSPCAKSTTTKIGLSMHRGAIQYEAAARIDHNVPENTITIHFARNRFGIAALRPSVTVRIVFSIVGDVAVHIEFWRGYGGGQAMKLALSQTHRNVEYAAFDDDTAIHSLKPFFEQHVKL